MLHFRNPWVLAGAISAWLVLVFVPGAWVDEDTYSAYAAGIQAFGIVLALLIGVATMNAATHNQAVDRVLALHAELTSGDTDRARRHLVDHLRKHATAGTQVRQVKISDLRSDPHLRTYSPNANRTILPTEDAVVVIRYFERVRLAQVSGSLNDAMTVELIGRHAAWWNLAIEDEGQTSRRALTALAEWANRYAASHAKKYPYLAPWGDTRLRDFGRY